MKVSVLRRLIDLFLIDLFLIDLFPMMVFSLSPQMATSPGRRRDIRRAPTMPTHSTTLFDEEG